LLRIRDDEIDDHRRAAGETGSGATLEIFARHRAHKWQLHVCVRVDAARHYILASRIDDLCTAWRFQVGADLLNLAICAQNVRTPGPFGRNNSTILN
jgi:hypothetical protein